MGLFDRLKSLVGGAAAAAVDMRGPLLLSPGDGVAYYRERFVLAGVRRLSHEGGVVWQYCLRDVDGRRAVLAVEEGPEPTLWMQRPVDCDVPWDRDVLDGVADEPFRLATHGVAAADVAGDPGVAPVRSVRFREFEDAAAERVVVLEDWGGAREARVGETVHEAELSFVRAEDDAAPQDGDGDEADTHAAAADALAGGGSPEEDADTAREDAARFDDESWNDEAEEECPEVSGPVVEAVMDSEEDEWLAATLHVRRHGVADAKAR